MRKIDCNFKALHAYSDGMLERVTAMSVGDGFILGTTKKKKVIFKLIVANNI